MSKKVAINILGISSGHGASSYTLILEEVSGNKKLPIIIGAFEAQAIAIEIEKIKPPRPMTHDLFKFLAENFEIAVEEVIIHRLKEGIFYAHIVCSKNGVIHQIDARTSDAIAIALRFNCPIYTYSHILEEAGMTLDELTEEDTETTSPPESTTQEEPTDNLSGKTTEELNEALEKAIEVENYILAAKIRDEVNRRK